MKRLVNCILAVGILITSACSQNKEGKKNTGEEDETISLQWKIKEGHPLTYSTQMDAIEESVFSLKLRKFLSLDGDELENNFDEMIDELKQVQANTKYRTILKKSEDFDKVIDIQMQSEPINEGVSGVSDSLSGLVDRLKESFKGVQLRGSIYENGMLHSFWVKSNQKNLLCMLFEIPPYPLKEGDEWTLRNVNLISNDHNFVCEKAKHINKVKLTSIEKRGDDRIAILDYNIYEYVEGTFGKTAPDGLEMELRFKGRAKFSVNLGRWIDYEGILSYVSSGYLTANSKQKIALKLEN